MASLSVNIRAPAVHRNPGTRLSAPPRPLQTAEEEVRRLSLAASCQQLPEGVNVIQALEGSQGSCRSVSRSEYQLISVGAEPSIMSSVHVTASSRALDYRVHYWRDMGLEIS